MIGGRWLRTSGGGACIVLGLLAAVACGVGDDSSVSTDRRDARIEAVAPIPDDLAAPQPVNTGRALGGARTAPVSEPAAGRPSAACETGRAIEPGVHTRQWHDVEREVIVRLPEPTDSTLAPPVVFNLHGSAASAATHEAYVHLTAPATARGYVVVIPEGMPPEEGGLQVWELFPGIYPDDPGYLASLVDWLGGEMCVDLDRIYATGFSNGSTMTNVIACHTEGRFRAIGAVAAHRFPIVCPSGPVSVIGIHGTDDWIVPYLGGPLLRRPEIWMPPVEETFGSWAHLGGCDVAPRYEVVVPEVVRRRWQGCADGIQVELYTIEGGGHSWPWIDDPLYPGPIDATTLILDFFDAN